MLQRALATLFCLLGAASIGLGAASATVWRASDTLVASVESGQATTLMLTEAGVLDMAADSVSVLATSTSGEKVVLALGRTADVEAWVGPDPHTSVTGLVDRTTLSTEDVAADEESAPADPAATAAPTPDPAATEPAADPSADPATADPAAEAAAAAAPDPSGSDLWIAEASAPDEATLEWARADGRWSILAASVGPDAGPVTLTLTWPQEVTTPWLVPGVAAGSVLLLAGLLWWALLLLRGRRRTPTLRVSVGPVAAVRPTAPAMPVATGAPATVGAPTAARPAGPAAAPASPRPIDGGRPTPTSPVPAGPRAQGNGTAQDAVPLPTPVPVPVSVPVDVIPGPVTRRQLREREQQLALQAQQEREQARSGHSRIRPREAQGPSQLEPGTLASAGGEDQRGGPRPAAPAFPPPAGSPAGPPVQPSAAPTHRAPPGAATAAPPAGTAPSAPTVAPGVPGPAAPPEPDATSSGNPLTRWGRRRSERVPRPTAAEPAVAPSPSTGGAGASTPVTEQPVPGGAPTGPARPAGGEARPEAGHAASADMWRRAWGFPGADGADSAGAAPVTWVPGQPGPPGAPTPGAHRGPARPDTDRTDDQDGDRR